MRRIERSHGGASLRTRASVAAMLVVALVLAVMAVDGGSHQLAWAQQGGIEFGDEVEVTGTGDCLRVHVDSSIQSAELDCLPDGTRARILAQGPQPFDGETWWRLAGRGWVVERFLASRLPRNPI